MKFLLLVSLVTFSLSTFAQEFSAIDGEDVPAGCCGVNSELIKMNHPLVAVYGPICGSQKSEESCKNPDPGAECTWNASPGVKCEQTPVEPTEPSCCGVNAELIKMNHPLVPVYQPLCAKQVSKNSCLEGAGAECAWNCK